MTEILYRAVPLTPGTGRTVFGIVAPYNQVAEVRDRGMPYRERFDHGAFTRSIRERGSKIRLFAVHDLRKLPIGKAVELREQPDGLHAAFEIAATRDGEDALELVRTGVVDGFSVGFKSIKQRQDGDVLVRTEAALLEVSLTGLPSYPGATVVGVRSHHDGLVITRSIASARLRLLDLER